MNNAIDVVVLIKLEVNPAMAGPEQQGALLFSYCLEPGNSSGADVQANGDICLERVKGEAKIKFVLMNREPLTWADGRTFRACIKEGSATNPRDSLWLAKGGKPTGPFPMTMGKNEFDYFQFSAWDATSMGVWTRNTDNTQPYYYCLAVKLVEMGAGNGATLVYRDDPQIRNGGNSITVRYAGLFTIGVSLAVGAMIGWLGTDLARFIGACIG